MSFVKGIFSTKKTRSGVGGGSEEFLDSGVRSPGMNGSPGGVRRSPAGVSSVVAATRARDSASPKNSPKRPHKFATREQQQHQKASKESTEMYNPTQEEIAAMNLPFKEKSTNKRDKNLSISRSGRHKYKNKQRMSVLQQDIYSDIPADLNQSSSPSSGASSPATGGGGGPASSKGGSGGFRGVEAHSRQFQSHQRPGLSISGASAAV